MIQKKICLLGAYAVGKTSLVMQYVDSIFSEKYHTSVGVKIDKKQLTVDQQDVTLMLWDLAGQDDMTRLRTSYLRGVSGYIVVVDGTRPVSLSIALSMYKEAREFSGELPFVVALNKADLQDDEQWQINTEQLDELKQHGAHILLTSAKNNSGVDDLFTALTQKILHSGNPPPHQPTGTP